MILDGVKKTMDTISDYIMEFITNLPDLIIKTFSGMLKTVFKTVLTPLASFIKDPITFISNIILKIINNGALSPLKGLIEDPKSFMENGF